MGWAERIPAVIEWAELHLDETCPCGRAECCADRGISEEEVGLAKALWKQSNSFGMWARADEEDAQDFQQEAHTALHAFCEKVESIA